MRVDALSRMWEAASIGWQLPPSAAAAPQSYEPTSDETPLTDVAAPAEVMVAVAAPPPAEARENLASDASAHVMPERESPGHSSVQTIMDESSIIPDASAVLDLPPASGAAVALAGELRVNGEEQDGMPSLRTASPQRIGTPHRGAHGVLAEITASNLLNHSLGPWPERKEVPGGSDAGAWTIGGNAPALYRKRRVEAARQLPGAAKEVSAACG